MSQQISKKFTEKVPANYIILLPFIFLFLLGCQDQNSSSSLTIQEKNLGENLVYLMDSEKSLTFNNILSQDKSGLFQKSDKLINLGLTRSAVWFRFFLPPTDDKSMKYFIEADNPTVDKVSLYAPTADGKYKSIHSGESVPMSKRPLSHHHILFPVTQQYDTTKAYYMRVESQSHIVMTIKLWSEKSFLKNDQNEQYVSGLAYGILLAMILYNLFIYISLMDKSYLFYVFFICNFLLFLMTLDGTAFHYLWPDWPYWSMRSGIFFSAFSQFVGIIFVRDFVNSKQYLPLVDKILLVIIAFNGLNSVLTFILPVYEMNIIGLIPSVIGPLMTVVASVLSWKRGYHPAIYFVIAFLALLVAGILYLITILGVMDSVFFKNHSMQFGSVLAVILFSLALADRINVMKHETDRLKDEFLANTSHELKTPLSGMIGLIDSLIAGSVGKLTEIQKAQLGLLSASGRRLSILINDILDFTRAKFQDLPLILEPVSLKAITDDVISISTGLIGIKPVSISNNVPDNLPAVEADRNRLEQILYNLVGNAIKFTDSGMVTISAEHKDDMIQISVSDTGIGIPNHQIDRIFKYFEQLNTRGKRQYGGTGIGLAVTKKLIEYHSSELLVESVFGEGSVFSFLLPASLEQPIEKLHTSISKVIEGLNTLQPLKLSVTNGKSIVLVVDDDPISQKVIENFLLPLNYNIIQKRNGFNIVQYIEEHSVDLVLLDVLMPDESGITVCRKIRENYGPAELPIIMITGRNQVSDLVAGFEAGANDYIVKPFFKEELISRIKSQLDLIHSSRELKKINEGLESMVTQRTEELTRARERAEKISEQIAQKNQILSEMAFRDSLTKLYNHNTFIERLKEIYHEAERYELPLAVLMLDIDYFKSVNDDYGHIAGDKTLQSVSSVIENELRQSDIASRYGGEEFALILTHCDKDKAMGIAERLRSKIESTEMKEYPTLHITASIGIAVTAGNNTIADWEDLLKQSDKALYQAKAQGRNRVILYEGD